MTDNTYAQVGKRLRSDPNSRHLVRLFAHIDSTLFSTGLQRGPLSIPHNQPPLPSPTDNTPRNTPKISSFRDCTAVSVRSKVSQQKKNSDALCIMLVSDRHWGRSPWNSKAHIPPCQGRAKCMHAPRGDDLSSIWICYDRTQKGGEWIQEAFEQSEPWEYTPPLSLGAIVPKLKMLTSQKSRLAHVNRNRQKRSEACTAKLPAWASAAHHHWH